MLFEQHCHFRVVILKTNSKYIGKSEEEMIEKVSPAYIFHHSDAFFFIVMISQIRQNMTVVLRKVL